MLFLLKILGLVPYEKSCFKSTEELSIDIIDLVKAPHDVQPTYIKHLALMVNKNVSHMYTMS